MTLNFELGTLNVFENAAALERLKPVELFRTTPCSRLEEGGQACRLCRLTP